MVDNNHYHHLVFGQNALDRQRRNGSYVAYGVHTERTDDGPMGLGAREANLIKKATQFYAATITPSGWPYLQYRSGPQGFLHVLDDKTIAFADFRGNNQFVTVANLEHNKRIALILVDYPRKLRLKLFATASVIEGSDDPELLETLRHTPSGTIAAKCERSIVLKVEAIDWNCSRSIIPRFDREYVKELSALYAADAARERETLQRRIAELEAEVATLSGGRDDQS
ncbi:pyridoxamine 5'-phosphate oxidase family protein [Hoyosella rhizosphaerae]|uniref:Pyridoxine 5-phosphate oxidase n=1 Tax=Hoyosella rhizosphaerae TaxID=1755582 RepID=A0A916U1I9_9ACTN|nr:pyridoxamine 5'-phosphate oxidase family protein [Hoyosella rhizosphaerae]MBN4926907.1 pyridoxamine 5'-phosphate oxidase family protein [Hoyosella rhizosphaerae]GGC55586.1 putative pyridoxine 5-phosphate oxidase [Hoyosella rhizosphaerae]